MATSSSYTCLSSSPTLPTRISPAPKQNPSLCCLLKLTQTKNHPFLGISSSFSSARITKTFVFVAKASKAEAQASKSEDGNEEEENEEYEVELIQPYGLRFVKGRDGGTYIDAIAPGGAADKTGLFTVGDKVLATSAVFGEEIWPAAEYGRTMYTIRQRIGPLLMKMQKRYGKMDEDGELTEKEIIRAERNLGVISNKVREIQMQNYIRKKEQKEQRKRDLREGLKLYKKLLEDEFYIGLRQNRATGEEYAKLLEGFMSAVKQNYGEKILIQFEDFPNHNAFDLLAKYRTTHLVFNGDIQGTASVVLAGIISALKVLGGTLADHTFLFLSAGEASTGLAELIALQICKTTDTPIEEARQKIWLVDSKVPRNKNALS